MTLHELWHLSLISEAIYLLISMALYFASSWYIAARKIKTLKIKLNTFLDNGLKAAFIESGDEQVSLNRFFPTIPLVALDAAQQVIQFGAKKYKMNGWKEIPDGYRYYKGKALNHLFARDMCDRESGLPHLAHVLVNASFALWHYDKQRQQEYMNEK